MKWFETDSLVFRYTHYCLLHHDINIFRVANIFIFVQIFYLSDSENRRKMVVRHLPVRGMHLHSESLTVRLQLNIIGAAGDSACVESSYA
jgi:hypothetical protein